MPTPTRRRPRGSRLRRGSALMLTMIFTLALGGLALSAIYMGGSTTMLSKLYDRERDYRYAAEWALAIGESRITTDTSLVLPDSLYVQLMNGQTVTDATGATVPKVKVDLFAGVGGNSTGQYGRFVELVAVAYDNGGARHVRRLELQAENFARYAMFVDQWPTGACYATGEILRGRAHSNQDWKNCSSAPGVIHTDTVSAVGTVQGVGQYQSAKISGHPKISFPTVTKLSFMPGYASSAGLSLSPAAKSGSTGGSRLEFTAVDLDGDGTLTGPAEGYFRVFDARSGASNNPWANPSSVRPYTTGGTDTTLLRMSTPVTTNFRSYLLGATTVQKSAILNQCGLYVPMGNPARQTFVPLAAFDTLDLRYKWIVDTLAAVPAAAIPSRVFAGSRANAVAWVQRIKTNADTAAKYMRVQTSPATSNGRCFPAGDPRLMPTERPGLFRAFPAAAGQSVDTLPNSWKRGGEDTTFSDTTKTGVWRRWPAYGGSFFTAGVTRRQANEEPYLWPVHRTQNLNSKGVIYVNGDIYLSGQFRGRATLYISGSGTFIDDLTYVTNPASLPICQNLLGIITGSNLMIADNNINRPRTMDGTGSPNAFLDDNQDFFLHAVTLSGVINSTATFGVENYSGGPNAGRQCTPVSGSTVTTSGGCIAQAGGVILRNITATFAGTGTGFAENRVKDACLDVDSPPFFPLTGRYLDNEFYELDPAVFNSIGVAQFYRRLQSAP